MVGSFRDGRGRRFVALRRVAVAAVRRWWWWFGGAAVEGVVWDGAEEAVKSRRSW